MEGEDILKGVDSLDGREPIEAEGVQGRVRRPGVVGGEGLLPLKDHTL